MAGQGKEGKEKKKPKRKPVTCAAPTCNLATFNQSTDVMPVAWASLLDP